ncbi:uncharacterized protein ARMOST_18856 [Armillaria ostoyae]|uniref:DUF6534 domain-containing protein n=1 Tax=Armillaria ostoyae TaxID=47428 RepID=A0A284S2X0_ARMOS|nr:uncharacterized protein ARMOST_18856 [Armillaria ostoyae]
MDSAAVVVPSLGTTIGTAYVGAMLSSLYVDPFDDSSSKSSSTTETTRTIGSFIVILSVYSGFSTHSTSVSLCTLYTTILWIRSEIMLRWGTLYGASKCATLMLEEYTLTDFDLHYLYQLQILVNVGRSRSSEVSPVHPFYYTGNSLRLAQSIRSTAMEIRAPFPSIPSLDRCKCALLLSHADLVGARSQQLNQPFLCVVISFFSSGLLVYKTYTITTFTGLASMGWAIDAAFATSTGIDFFISFAMCYYLHKSRSISEFSSTNSRLLVLMWFVLMSGLATSACSTVALVTFIVLPNTLVFLGVEFLLTKLYVNSLLSMLNARKRLQGANTGSGTGLSEPTSFSNIIRLTPTAGGANAGDVKRGGFDIPLSEICSSAPSQKNEDSSQTVEDKRSRAGFSVV